ncbi:hypothetical protein D3C71_2197610 [compost metagenome]
MVCEPRTAEDNQILAWQLFEVIDFFLDIFFHESGIIPFDFLQRRGKNDFGCLFNPLGMIPFMLRS